MYLSSNNKIPKEVEQILKIKDKKLQYEQIINYISNYLINNIKIYELCDFKNNQCIANRLNKSVHKLDGCCYKNKDKCKKLKANKCSIDSISCKLFICNYLEKKYHKIKLQKIFPINKVFNRKQQQIIKTSFFKDKNEIINLLLSNK